MTFDEFIEDAKKEIARKQAVIVRFALDSLYENSPHIGEPDSPWSEGEYEINHKISINGQAASVHHPPLQKNSSSFQQATEKGENFYESIMSGSDPEKAMSEFEKITGITVDRIPAALMQEQASRNYINLEKEKTRQIQCGDHVKVFNTTDHVDDVEDGGVHWRRKPNGYGTYRKAKRLVKAKYKNVIE